MQPEALATAFLNTPEKEIHSFLTDHQADLVPAFITELEHNAERLRLEAPNQALYVAERLQKIATFLVDEALQASALRIKGNLLIQLGHYAESISCYAEARDIRSQRGESLEIARLQVGWTAALKNLDRHSEALDLALATRDILAQHEKWNWLANLEMNIGSIYRLTDHFTDALAIYAECQKHFLQADNPVGAAQAYVNQARTLSNLDRFSEALALLHQARSTFDKHHKWDPLARTDMNLGTLYLWMGRYHEAWESYNRAWEGFRKQGNEMETAIVSLYRSQVYLDLNLFPEALESAQLAGEVCGRLGMSRYVAVSDFCQARACRGLARNAEALKLLEKAHHFFASPAGAATWAALIDLEQATLLRESKQPAAALQALTAACEVFSDHRHHIRLAQAQLMTAECYRDLSENERAKSLYRAVLDLPARQRLPTLAYRAHYGLGQVEEAHNHPGIAHRHYRAAIRQIEIIRRGIQVDEFKASFLDDKLAAYRAAVRLSLERDNLAEAFAMVERAKSSALLDLLARSLELKAEEGETVDSQVWEQLRQLKETWAWHYSRLEKPSAEDEGNGLRGRIPDDHNWEALHRVEAKFNQTLRQIQGHRLASLTRETYISWKRTADLLRKDDLLIEYFCLDDKLVAFLIDSQGLRVVQEFPYSLREIRRSASVLNLALKRLRGLEPTYIQEVLGPLARRHLSWLYQALVAPLKIDGKQKLIILPDDVLHYLPFHAFHDGKRYLIERCELQYAPSASVLALCHTVKTGLPNHMTQHPALILGYSNSGQLQHVSNETKTVAATLKSSRLFQETDATLAHLRQYGVDSRLIHIASHADFRADNPLFSSIQLADEPLNVIDLYHLDLRAQLVTLSACETGINQLKGGDLFGLVRGCLYAGAPSVVVSLWQVDDASTAELMQNFYQQLKGGERLGSALRRAQLQFLQADSEVTHHPHYWAPFCLIGADGNIS